MKRGRNQRRRQGMNPNRALDSNGPDVRIRGTANQIYDKYQALARDAASSGDRVKAENYLQHAEHYYRMIRAMQPDRPAPDMNDQDGDYDMDAQPSPRRSSRPANGPEQGQERGSDSADDQDDEMDNDERPAQAKPSGEGDEPKPARSRPRKEEDSAGAADGEAKPVERKPRRKKRAPRAAKPAADEDGAAEKVQEEASA